MAGPFPISCWAYRNPVYAPAMRIVTGITNANPCVVTTSFAHGYLTGTIVRIDIPTQPRITQSFGMQQINQQFAPLTVLSPTTFSLPIDTTFYDPFVSIPDSYKFTCPQSVPIGELASMLTAAVNNQLNPS